jgi:excinuclease ABC subunit B
LPSARDNRPLTFDEFDERAPRILYPSATPGPHERSVATLEAEQIIRPTGLLDPIVELRPLAHQVDDVIEEIRRNTEHGGRTLVAALTKRSCEDLAQYLLDIGIKSEYLHSDIDAIERVDILARLRRGEIDALIGVNLLREGLDLPEATRVAILDADKEGFLRSETSLVQTAGRCARNVEGRVILYADTKTPAIEALLAITEAHRAKQAAYNEANGIVPQSVIRPINEDLSDPAKKGSRKKGKTSDPPPAAFYVAEEAASTEQLLLALQSIEAEMRAAAEALEFERAALLRDEMRALRARLK